VSEQKPVTNHLNPEPWSLRRKILTGAGTVVAAAAIVSSATFGPLLFAASPASTTTPEPSVSTSVTPEPSTTPGIATPTPEPSSAAPQATDAPAAPAPSVQAPAAPAAPVQQQPAAPAAPQPPAPVKCPEGTVPGAVDDYGNESNCAPPCQAYDDNNVCTSPGTGALIYRLREPVEVAA
jgi:hypothetical protein